jgi:hypothetical protein
MGMNEGGYSCIGEEQIAQVENWIDVFQRHGAEGGIHPADLVELIVTFIEAKELFDTGQTEGAAFEAKFGEVSQKLEELIRQVEGEVEGREERKEEVGVMQR